MMRNAAASRGKAMGMAALLGMAKQAKGSAKPAPKKKAAPARGKARGKAPMPPMGPGGPMGPMGY
jgi:hypothetical protein